MQSFLGFPAGVAVAIEASIIKSADLTTSLLFSNVFMTGSPNFVGRALTFHNVFEGAAFWDDAAFGAQRDPPELGEQEMRLKSNGG
jgi:hypothetical protein